jgi:hypothetical protein
MKSPLLILAIAILFATSLNSLACQPITGVRKPSLNEAKRNFDEATFVVIAEVVDVRTVTFDIGYPVERATFRVERAFKGALKAGAIFRIETGMSTCGRGILDDGWKPPPPPSIGGTHAAPQRYPKQWLIYYVAPTAEHPSEFEITYSSHTQPLSEATFDVHVLEKNAKRWGRGQ